MDQSSNNAAASRSVGVSEEGAGKPAGKKQNEAEDSKQQENRKALKRVGNFVLGDVLGEGAYGQVREGLRVSEDQKFGQRVAVKIISRRLLRKVRNGQDNLKREIKCLKKVKHKNVIQLYDVIDEDELDKVYLVFELANLFSLQDLIDMQKQATRKLSGPEGSQQNPEAIPYAYARNIFLQLVHGLQACHSKGVVHRDIKPSNLQLTSDGVVKLIDFGVAETLDDFSTLDDTQKFAGTPSFQPPEVAQGARSFSATKVDIWAAGVTLYVMVTATHPFTGDSMADLYANISTGEYEMPAALEAEVKDLISKTMHREPEHRLPLEEMLSHPWSLQEGAQLGKLLPTLELNTEKKQSLLNRYMEENDSDEEGEEESDDDQFEEDRLKNAEILSGKRTAPMPFAIDFNRSKQARALSKV
eukprot:CAMPEP_0177709994 /NCGR_PEP_ID=MMETSP0484_2-20121128/11097_1 /TAXON_ID=354590 /ORGANISM="Rhodomonas lens, Strain RHODO" /LENGTH=414 /DNA_ID=CAMNT_0019221643 /DNA_START=357 /DNA_END=1598 /DNA_ORIENTATION=-